MKPFPNFCSFLFLIFLSSFFSSTKSYSQKNDFEVGFYNAAVGGFVGGVGAVINKERDENFFKAFAKGLGQGALGGYLIFESKRLIRNFSKTGNYSYVWPSKLVHSAGASIIENAALNHPFGESWHLNIAFNRIEFDFQDGFDVNYKIMPFALAGTIYTATKGSFNLERSAKTGTFVFRSAKIVNKEREEDFIYGQVPLFSNSILLLDTWEGDYAMAHELVHVYQSDGLVGFNSFVDKPLENLQDQNEFMNNYLKFIYLDIHRVLNLGLYNLELKQKAGYRGNIFELEATYFGPRNPNSPGRPVLL